MSTQGDCEAHILWVSTKMSHHLNFVDCLSVIHVYIVYILQNTDIFLGHIVSLDFTRYAYPRVSKCLTLVYPKGIGKRTFFEYQINHLNFVDSLHFADIFLGYPSKFNSCINQRVFCKVRSWLLRPHQVINQSHEFRNFHNSLIF